MENQFPDLNKNNDNFTADRQIELNRYNEEYGKLQARLLYCDITADELDLCQYLISSIIKEIEESIAVCERNLYACTYNDEIIMANDTEFKIAKKFTSDLKKAHLTMKERIKIAENFLQQFNACKENFSLLLYQAGGTDESEQKQGFQKVHSLYKVGYHGSGDESADNNQNEPTHSLDNQNKYYTSQAVQSVSDYPGYSQQSYGHLVQNEDDYLSTNNSSISNPFITKQRFKGPKTKTRSEQSEEIRKYFIYDKSQLSDLPSKLKSFYFQDDANDWAKKRYKKWRASLSEQDVDNFRAYAGTTFENINSQLRNKQTDTQIQNYINTLSSALNRAVLPEDIVVYRAVEENAVKAFQDELGGRIQKGVILTDKAFISTSLTSDAQFCFNRPCIMRIVAPAGLHAAPLFPGDLSSKLHEGELLFQKNPCFYVKSVVDCVRDDIIHNGDMNPVTVIEATIGYREG